MFTEMLLEKNQLILKEKQNYIYVLIENFKTKPH